MPIRYVLSVLIMRDNINYFNCMKRKCEQCKNYINCFKYKKKRENKRRKEKMIIDAMILAWILSWFNLDNILIDAINQILNTNYTTAVYWLLFFAAGLIATLIKR